MKDVATSDRFLAAFHAGARWAMEETYREHARRVIAAARRAVDPVDAETVAHDVFRRLLSDEPLRKTFEGGNLAAWFTTVAVPQAVDALQRRRGVDAPVETTTLVDDEMEAKVLVARFRSEVLAKEDKELFEARFIHRKKKRDAAVFLGLSLDRLAAEEQRLREQLERFVVES